MSFRGMREAALVTMLVLGLNGQALAAPPANDNFTNATTLPPAAFTISGSTVEATVELAEPNHAGTEGSASVWFRWTAPATTTAGFSTFGSTFDTALAVYTGTAFDSPLTLIDQNDDTFPGNTSYVEFPTTMGTTYLIAVTGYQNVAGQFTLTSTPAPNDAFANRTALTGSSFTVRDVNNLATKEVDEDDHGGDVGGHSLWYKWTAPATARVAVTTIANDTSFDTLLAVYTGSAVGSLTLVDQNNDEAASSQSLVEFDAVAGTEYQIAVDGAAGANDAFVLSLVPAPTNDAFASRALLSGTNPTASGYTFGARKEADEPNHAGDAGGHSVWYTWTAPASGNVGVTTTGSSFDSTLAVYTGTSVNALMMIAQNDDDGGAPTSALVFLATAGVTYQIAIDGALGAAGNLILALAPPPANDNFANRIGLLGDSTLTAVNNVAATKEAGEPNHAGNAGGKSLWFDWTPASSGHGRVTTGGAPFDVLLDAYRGVAVDSLTVIGSFRSSNTLFFPVAAGVTYRLAVDGQEGLSGAFSLLTAVDAPEVFPANDDLAHAQLLTGLLASASGDNGFATTETGEPAHAGTQASQSVWYSYVAPESRSMRLAAVTSDGSRTRLAVYTGGSFAGFTQVASSAATVIEDPDATTELVFDAVAGTTYSIAVDRNGNSGFFTLTLNPATVTLTGGVTASVNPAVVGQGIVFSVAPDAAATLSYDFGDGTSVTSTATAVNHSYGAAGTYMVKVTATLPLGATATSTTSVVVRPVLNLQVLKTAIKLGVKPKSDSIQVSGVLQVPDGVDVGGKTLAVNIGGIVKTFTLDGRGTAKVGNDSAKLSYKRLGGGGKAKFTIKFAKGDFDAALNTLGFTDATIANKVVVVPIEIVFNGTAYQASPALVYKAKAGKGGSAK